MKNLPSPPNRRKRSREARCLEGYPHPPKRQRYGSASPGLSISRESNALASGFWAHTQDRERHKNQTVPSNMRREEDYRTGESAPKRFKPGSAEFIAYWAKNTEWPQEAFKSGLVKPQTIPSLSAQKELSQSLRRKRSESSIADSSTPSDQKPYTHPSYPLLLEAQGVRMTRSELDILDTSKTLCRHLLNTECDLPGNTLFQDDILEESIQALQGMNESRVVQDIARLIVPSAETLSRISEKGFNILVESVNEGWYNCFPLTGPRPQPDYAVGFRQSALGDGRIKKLRAIVGDEPFFYQSCLMATHYMYFPFFTSEVICGTAGLEIADRQNAHSMGLAVRAIFSIFELGKRHMELHRRILTFSVSHNHQEIELYGWYPIINGQSYSIHRHVLRSFNLLDMDGRDKWTAYSFSIGVYRYALGLLRQINAIIDELPGDLNLESLRDLECLQLGQQNYQPLGRSEKSRSSKQLEDESHASKHFSLSQQLDHYSLTAEVPGSLPNNS